jgi:glycine C-acetyltransferase
MLPEFEQQVSQTLEEIKSQGLFKTERIITSPQDAHIAIAGGKRVLNMCKQLSRSRRSSCADRCEGSAGYARFRHGERAFYLWTQDIHKDSKPRSRASSGPRTRSLPIVLRRNGGLFETLLTDKDAVISDD